MPVHRWLGILLIAGAGILAYANSFNGPFIFDDTPSIVNNAHIRHLWPIWNTLQTPNSSVANRPIVSLSLAINYALGELQVWGYHAFNVGVHILVALTLFGIIHRLARRLQYNQRDPAAGYGLATVVALLWVVHPLPTDAINHLIYRTEQMMSLFYLLTIFCVIRAADSDQPRNWYRAAVIACALGMGSKENMATAPLLVLLLDRCLLAGSWRELWRQRRWLYAGLAGSWLMLVAAMWSGQRHDGIGFNNPALPAMSYWLTQCDILMHYLWLCYWPHPLVLDLGDWPVSLTIGEVWWQVLSTMLLLGVTGWGLWKRRWWGVVGTLFFFILAPTSLLPNPGEIAAEHRMYLPLAMVILLTVMVAKQLFLHWSAWIIRPIDRQYLQFGGATLAVLLLVAATIRRNEDYRTSLSIWQDTVAKRPMNPRPYIGLAGAYLEAGQPIEAEYYLRRSLDIRPRDCGALNNLGVAVAQQGRHDEAMTYYQQALSVRPLYGPAFRNFGAGLANNENIEETLSKLGDAFHIDTAALVRSHSAGEKMLRAGQLDQALLEYEKVLQGVPQPAVMHNNLGVALMKQGKYPEAMVHFLLAAEEQPDFAAPYYNFADLLLGYEELDRAEALYQQALALEPQLAEAHHNLGYIYEVRGLMEPARQEYERALAIKPELAEAYNSLGILLANQSNWLGAQQQFSLALEKNPQLHAAQANLEAISQHLAGQTPATESPVGQTLP
ncbi:MAG: Photosystem I assembly protein Ycf3 [Phycisphaerae bacterium]|nr:Photosystem I assembly protein Ycf3 [Phycisphaerae bacterium]